MFDQGRVSVQDHDGQRVRERLCLTGSGVGHAGRDVPGGEQCRRAHDRVELYEWGSDVEVDDVRVAYDPGNAY